MICPVCVTDMHSQCPGDAWDDDRRRLVDCSCYASGHRKERIISGWYPR